MEKRRINLSTIFLICIVSLIIGAGIGYFIYETVNKENMDIAIQNGNTQKFDEEEIEVKNEESKTIVENVKPIIENNESFNNSANSIEYDGSKKIDINGKNYTISYVSEEFEHFNNSESKQTEVKLYLNDKYIGTANLQHITDINHTYGSKDYDVEVYTISEKYIVILLKTEYNDGINAKMSRRIFFIINNDGIHIDTLEWFNSTQIIAKENAKELKYEIDDEGVILYEINGNIAMKNKYIPVRDVIKKVILQVLDENEISLAGK